SLVATPDKQTNSIELAYPWGRVSCAYGKQGNALTMRIEVSNTSAQGLDNLSLRLMELDFPSVPDGGTLEAGMFGFGFKGPRVALRSISSFDSFSCRSTGCRADCQRELPNRCAQLLQRRS